MTAATAPSVPPRPSRSSDRDASTPTMPKIPPRPYKKIPERSLSPNADRFAPSPLNEGILSRSNPKPPAVSPNLNTPTDDPIDRAGSVPMPSVGEEGLEYGAVTDEFQNDDSDRAVSSRAASPEQTRTVAQDLKLHAPKPSLPATSAKQRVEGVTRTDSDRAASFGIGYPGSGDDRATSRDGVKKRPSTSFSTNSDHGQITDDDHGIPEIGQRVPMNPDLGDVQAPSPGPEGGRHHARKHSARSLPPGSYGLHGHGVAPQDKLEKAYYEKHPDLIKREENTPLHDRQNDYAMSSTDLNKLVRQTASRGAAYASTPELQGTPTDEVAFQASEEYVRMTSPNPGSEQKGTPRRPSSSLAKTAVANNMAAAESQDEAIHVEEPKNTEYRSYGDEDAPDDEEAEEYTAPILAPDEVDKDPNAHLQRPAIHPRSERRGSSYESDDASSRPVSRPTSVHINLQPEIRYTPLEDVEEYEPLFPENSKEAKEAKKSAEAVEQSKQNHFPSKDIWEDAPSSAYYTATVSTPDIPEHHRTRSSGTHTERPITPAHAFAQHQEELAEKEARGRSAGAPSSFLPLADRDTDRPPLWVDRQKHVKSERPSPARFPSRDVWEDVPESQLQQTVILSPEEEETKPEAPSRPAKKSPEASERPAVPTRPKPRQTSVDDAKPKPPVSDKPKPQIPARPAKSSPSVEAKEKPPVPSRPMGNKIAALQAGFMSDLNKRLKVGPPVPKKEESTEPEAVEEKEKIPLSDARKGRARGPQRRAPAKAAAPVKDTAAPTLSFSIPQISWSIDPEQGTLSVDDEEGEQPVEEEAPVAEEVEAKAAEPAAEEKAAEPVTQKEPTESTVEEPSVEQVAEEKSVDTERKPEEPEEDEKTETQEELSGREEKTLTANMAGESVLEAVVDKKDDDTVEPVAVADEVKP